MGAVGSELDRCAVSSVGGAFASFGGVRILPMCARLLWEAIGSHIGWRWPGGSEEEMGELFEAPTCVV